MPTDNQFQTLTVRRGQDAVIAVSDTVDTVTGFALRFCVRANPGTDATALLTKTTGGGGVTITGANAFEVALSDDDTEALTLPAGRYAWDCWRTDAGSESPLCGGDFYLLERPLLSTLGRFRAHLRLTTTAEDAGLLQLLAAASKAVVELLGWDPAPRVVTEYYDGNGTLWLPLRTPVVRSITSLYVDEDGYYGQGTTPFPAETLLTAGTDYALKLDGPGAAYSRSGLVLRIGRAWPYRVLRRVGLLGGQRIPCPGCVKVTMAAGFAAVPEDLEYLAMSAAALMRASAPHGRLIASEGYKEYSISFGGATDAVSAVGSSESILARYRSFHLF